jgi:hypothetical protein
MPRTPRYSDADLAAAVAQSVTIAGVMRILGIRQAGGSHFHISRRIRRLGLDTSHLLGASFRKGTQQSRLSPDSILVKRAPDLPRAKSHMLRRALAEVEVPIECQTCGTSDMWMGRPLTLHVDHIDGDYSNCLRENLRFLCPNCHSQTSTYCRKMSSRSQKRTA